MTSRWGTGCVRVGLVGCVLGWVFGLSQPAGVVAQTTTKTGPATKMGTSTKANTVPKPGKAGPADYKSRNFLIHTDLPADEAQDLLKRLETMLSLISTYWGKPLSGTIECYVVKDIKNWPENAFPPEGLQSILNGAGVTVTQTITQGNNFIAKSVVYAIADRGTPQHEAVHAYCGQTFGRTGPTWYSEGMAEMGQYWREKDPSVNAHPGVIRYLRQSDPKSLQEIVNAREFTGDSWQNYAWRWALCHLLANNPNYSQRFRPLGLGLLTRQPVSFDTVYGDMAKEISFEYLFFLQHLEAGYRVDLCSWDWKAKFKKNRSGLIATSLVDAGHGWQASRLTVQKGDVYEYSVSGTWSLEKGGEALTADGGSQGKGKLIGVLMDDYRLGKPFELGTFGTFTAEYDGDLYLRCQDAWNELADNKGKLTIKLKIQGKGTPLVPPKETSTSKSGTPSNEVKTESAPRP